MTMLVIPVVPMMTMEMMTVTLLLMRSVFIRRYDASAVDAATSVAWRISAKALCRL